MKSLFEFGDEKLSSEEAGSMNETNIKETYEKLSKIPKTDLMQTLLAEVEKQKRNGTFDYQNLKNMLNSIAPMLSDEQKANISAMLERIK